MKLLLEAYARIYIIFADLLHVKCHLESEEFANTLGDVAKASEAPLQCIK